MAPLTQKASPETGGVSTARDGGEKLWVPKLRNPLDRAHCLLNTPGKNTVRMLNRIMIPVSGAGKTTAWKSSLSCEESKPKSIAQLESLVCGIVREHDLHPRNKEIPYFVTLERGCIFTPTKKSNYGTRQVAEISWLFVMKSRHKDIKNRKKFTFNMRYLQWFITNDNFPF